MFRSTRLVPLLTLLVGGLGGWAVASGRLESVLRAEMKPAAQPPSKADDATAGIRKNADEYTKAFNAGDAKAAAMSWTSDGEYTGDEGETLHGREAIEKQLAAFLTA